MIITEYYLTHLIWLMCFVAYSFYLGWVGRHVMFECSRWCKVCFLASVGANILGCALGLMTL